MFTKKQRNIGLLLLLIIVILASIALAYVYFEGQNTNTVSFITPTGNYTINVRIATNEQEWEQGLMNVSDLAPDAGMLFVFPDEYNYSFWMHNTPIPLDQVFIDSNLTITAINADALPENDSVFTAYGQYVVEVNGNYCAEHGITIGDKVTIKPPVSSNLEKT
jgi:hypothetical protein